MINICIGYPTKSANIRFKWSKKSKKSLSPELRHSLGGGNPVHLLSFRPQGETLVPTEGRDPLDSSHSFRVVIFPLIMYAPFDKGGIRGFPERVVS
jgi:hypothetical protein